jgi:hypothetical protein
MRRTSTLGTSTSMARGGGPASCGGPARWAPPPAWLGEGDLLHAADQHAGHLHQHPAPQPPVLARPRVHRYRTVLPGTRPSEGGGRGGKAGSCRLKQGRACLRPAPPTRSAGIDCSGFVRWQHLPSSYAAPAAPERPDSQAARAAARMEIACDSEFAKPVCPAAAL